MSVIGYLRRCQDCDAHMLVTVESKNVLLCNDCIDNYILEAAEAAADRDADDHIPPGQVRG